MCRQAVLRKEILERVSREEFIGFGEFLENSGGGAGNGVGYMDSETGHAVSYKGLEVSWGELWSFLQSNSDNILDNFVIHTRIPSVGIKMDELCHPFALNPNRHFQTPFPWDLDEYVGNLDYFEKQHRHVPTLLAYNGTWRDWKDIYPHLAAMGHVLPWYGSDNLSDALVMAHMIFGMGDKMAPAIKGGAAIILHPGVVLLAVEKKRILKYSKWKGLPVISSVIPANLGFADNPLKNVKEGVFYTTDLELDDKILEAYTQYGYQSTTVVYGSSGEFKKGICDGCGKDKHCKILGDWLFCYPCRDTEEFDEEEWKKASKEEHEEKNGDDDPLENSGRNSNPGSTNSDTPKSTGHEVVIYSNIDKSHRLQVDVFHHDGRGLSQLDDRFPPLHWDTESDQILWHIGQNDWLVLGTAETFFSTDILVNMELGGVFYRLFHKPSWGAVWLDLDGLNYVVWDALGLTEPIDPKNKQSKVELYYKNKKSKTGISRMKTHWTVLGNPDSHQVYGQWGIVYNFDSLMSFVGFVRPKSREISIQVSYFGPGCELEENKAVLGYFDVIERGECALCGLDIATKYVDETWLCSACHRQMRKVVLEDAV